jgi:hypothetical protein
VHRHDAAGLFHLALERGQRSVRYQGTAEAARPSATSPA